MASCLHVALAVSLVFGCLSGCSATSTTKTEKLQMLILDERLYIDNAMSVEKRKQLKQSLQQAKTVIKTFFGNLQSTPEIYACSTQQCYDHFDNVGSIAKTIKGQTIILSAQALNPTTITHELVHAEFASRLASPQIWNKVPMWFDEGLAALVCDHPKYSDEIKQYSLKLLSSQKQWMTAVKSNKPVYKIARKAVEQWYQVKGKKGLFDLIARLKSGENIEFESFISTINTPI